MQQSRKECIAWNRGLKPFLDVEHDHKGYPSGGAVPGISRGFLWGITIAADPDYGLSFDKK
jgi:hypothetical protein